MWLNMLYFVLKGEFAVTTKDHQFDPIKRSKLIQRLISWLTTWWVDDNLKLYCCLHWINLKKRDVIDSGSDHPMAGLAFSLAERYFSPAMGRNTFLPGRNGRNWGETSRCVYFKVQSITMCNPWYHQVHLYRYTIKLLMFLSV